MTSDLCINDVVVHISGPHVISTEAAVSSYGTSGRVQQGSGGAELGRRLLVAAREGDTNAVLELMAKGTPFTTDWLGTSPLHLAASNAHLDTCAVLLRAGVSRDSRTKVDRTPLHLAAYEGHERVVALLLEHGALVDCRDMLRMTPLHWAAQRGHAAAVQELLRRGADPVAVSKFGATPVTLARRSLLGDRSGLASLLEEAARAREAARSVRALVSEQSLVEAQPPAPLLQTFETVQKIQESNLAQKPTKLLGQHQPQQQEKVHNTNAERNPRLQSGAQLLRRHGITLLPADEGTTVLSALQSGRSVVLSDAGKLMLKESVERTTVGQGVATSTSGKGVLLTATAVRSPPRAGVKIFTLNNNLLVPADTPQSGVAAKRAATPQNLQVKYVQLPSDVRVEPGAGAARAKRSAGTPVKIILNRANFTKLLAPLPSAGSSTSSTGSATSVTAESALAQAEAVLRIPDEWVERCSHKQMRAHVTQARRALAALLLHCRPPSVP